MDLINTITMLIFPTLAATINEMNNHTLKSHYGIEPTDANIAILNSMITTSATVGMVFSLFFIMPIAETKGRKLAVTYFRFIITLVCSFCQLLSALTQATELFILGQILNGLQIPLRAFVTLMYITECAPDKYRGFASSAVIFSDVIGQLIMFSVGSPSALGKQSTWFIFPLVVIISSVVNFGMAARLPESPKWLVRQNRLEEATKAIEFYQGDSCNLNDVLTSYIKEKNLTQEDKISFRQVWENDTMREALKVLCSVSLFLILDSGAVQGTYTVLLHTTAGYTVQETMNIKLILTILFFPTRFIGTYLLDALGRRPVMAIAGVIVYSKTWLMLITQIIIYFVGPSLLTKILYLGVEALSNSTFATGVASLGILFISELFPPSARTTVAQALIMVTMIIDLPLIASFPIVYAIFGPGYFFIHIFTQVFFGTYLYRHMPETKGRAVYDIIEAMDQDVASRTATFIEEKTPLIRKRVSLSFPSKFSSYIIFFSPQHLPSNETAYSTLLGHGVFLLILAAICLICSSFFISSELFLLAEIFIGIEHPLRTYTTIMFVTECAPDKNRGFASTALIFAQVIGRMLLYSLGSPGIFGTTGLWFVFPVFVALCSALMLILTSKLPDSPKWLVCQNRIEEAKTSINYYHGPKTDIEQVLISLVKEKNLTTESKLSFKQVLGDETMKEALGVIFAITFFFLLDGTSSQSVYTVVLHKNAGFTVQETMNISLILVIVFFPTKFIGTYIIDALGRRPVMLLGGFICFSKSVLMIATQLVIYFAGESLLTKIMYVAVESLTGAIPATGVNTLHVLFISELFPPSARTSVAQVLLMTAIAIDSPLLSLFPFVYSIFPPGFFAPFAMSQFFFGIYLYRHMPETSGRAVYDIIDSMEQVVFSRSQTLAGEKAPLLRDRVKYFSPYLSIMNLQASTLLATKRNSILNTSRARVKNGVS
ncbi:hypothetical protein B9Z55_023845 [Caenorhabditis nigoni]|nr:hypothetical protein B9Z55_023845 [Caenorhabditis nigoni]